MRVAYLGLDFVTKTLYARRTGKMEGLTGSQVKAVVQTVAVDRLERNSSYWLAKYLIFS
jgi:hypothetical protein